MSYNIIVGRDEKDLEKFGDKGLVLLGKQYVKMGEFTSLSNNIYLDIARAHVILVSGKRGSGKCVLGDTLIPLEDGSVIPIRDLKENNNKVIGLNNKLKIQTFDKLNFFEREVNEIVKLKLRSGREIKLTLEHPLLTIKGWKPVSELTLGHRIAVPRNIDIFGKEEMPEHEAKLLAYLLAEGHTKKVVLFSNSDPIIVDEFKESLKTFDPSLRLLMDKKDHYRISCPDWKNKVLESICNKDKNGKVIRFTNIYEKRSIRKLIEREEMYGLLATQKFISNKIFKLKKELLSLFLNRLFSCDGSIYKDKKGNSYYWEISYSSSSKRLIHQIQHLILRFGILSKLREKKVKNNGKLFDSYEIVINEVEIPKFIEKIGFFGQKEIKQKIALNEILNSDKIRNPNIDTIPKEIWELYKPDNWAKIGRFAGYKHPKAMRERMRYCPSRQTLQMIANSEQNESLRMLATSDIFWDELLSIEKIDGKFKVYDISVPEFHNFVANDIIIHNSYTLGSIAESMANLPEEVSNKLAVLIFDTMGIFWSMKFPNVKEEETLKEWDLKPQGLKVKVYVPKGHFQDFRDKNIPIDSSFAIRPNELSSLDWCSVFNISNLEPIGILISRIIDDLKGNYEIKDIIEALQEDNKSDQIAKDASENLFKIANSWGLFDKQGTLIKDLVKGKQVSILDLSVYKDWNIKCLVTSLISKKLLEERILIRKQEEIENIHNEGHYTNIENIKEEMPLVWLMVDEAHEFLPKEGKSIATDALISLLREGRQPGISLVLATQQPGEIHNDVITQSDIVISLRVTAKRDIEALNNIMQTYLITDILGYLNNLPKIKGAAIVLDDNSERIYSIKVKPKMSWHGGETPSAVKIKKELLEL